MMPSPSEAPRVSPLDAGLLLAALAPARRLGLTVPTSAEIIAAAGGHRSRIYEIKALIEEDIPKLLRKPGRPQAPDVPMQPRPDLAGAALEYVYDHPGSVEGGKRQQYSDGFRHFILELVSTHYDVSLEDFAAAVRVPVPTLKDWLKGGIDATKPGGNLSVAPIMDPTGPQIEQLLALWTAWRGKFAAFCKHANHDWRLPFGRTAIATILAGYGVRFVKRRSGRSPDEDALRGAFLTYFPNAQWVGDGALISVNYGPERFDFNLQLLVDPLSGAFVGLTVSDTEDAASVVTAFEDAATTTGATPLSVLLDNKPSNHCELVHNALAPAVVERSTQ